MFHLIAKCFGIARFVLEFVLSKLSLRGGFLYRSSCKVRHPFLLAEASGYYLPEGRYYAAPLVVKRKKQRNYVFPVVLGIGLSFASISSLQQQSQQPLVAAATTVLIRSTDLHTSTMLVAVDPVTTGAIAPVMKSGAATETGKVMKQGSHAAVPDEDRLNRHEKKSAVIRRKANNRPLLTNYRTARVFVSVPRGNSNSRYVARLVSPEEAKVKFQITRTLVSVPQKNEHPKLPVPKILASLVTNDKPDILALGYAPADISKMKESPFDSILNEEERKTGGRFIPPVGPKDHPWVASPVPVSTFLPAQQKCLAEAVYFEARSESLKGQVAVAQVVLNRVRNPAYPDTVCGVVYQNVKWYNRCQFSFACDGKRHRVTERRYWRIAQDVARAASAGQIWLAEIGSSTHYHAVYVRPRWAHMMDKMQKIGQHIFYRTKGGGWS